eukprot:NODE_33820_length_277_cov_2.713333.p2 GENE.NODE_33820_length_277_cov_2.713333~~NODE_33820_length_277_cov_2.713333.p2  ORF type:complete len:54 (+),score=11.99 NODE_33820_length_277_cov_2.713333:67-228(+)
MSRPSARGDLRERSKSSTQTCGADLRYSTFSLTELERIHALSSPEVTEISPSA